MNISSRNHDIHVFEVHARPASHSERRFVDTYCVTVVVEYEDESEATLHRVAESRETLLPDRHALVTMRGCNLPDRSPEQE